MQKLISYDEIKAFEPCYDPNKFIPNDWLGTVIDILKMTTVPAKDRLWVCVRHQFLTDRQLHLYALACARQVENNSQDPRVKECNNVMEAFLKGEATKEQLSSAYDAAARCSVSSGSATASAYAANSAAYAIATTYAAAYAASCSSSTTAAYAAANSAGYAATATAANSAAYAAANSAGYAATATAANSAAYAAANSAAALTAAQEQQCEMLIKIIQENP